MPVARLSDALKAVIKSPVARPDVLPATPAVRTAYDSIARHALEQKLPMQAWLGICAGATMTMNSPESLLELFRLATKDEQHKQIVETAEFMKEVGLKCISFNGIPRAINCLNAFHAGLPEGVRRDVWRASQRNLHQTNAGTITSDGDRLWKSVYSPLDEKLKDKLAQAHPDLPGYIISHHYGSLLSSPFQLPDGAKVGRVATSLVAVACLRAQTGVGPQVISHVFGLRKAFEDGTAEANLGQSRWLATDDGSIWLLESVDRIVEAISKGNGTSFAPGFKPRL